METDGYQTIASEIKYRGAIIDVKQDVIVLPNGKRAMREIVLRGRAAAVLPVDGDGNVVLVRQYRHSVGKVVYEIPAGMMEDGEDDPRECAARELKEETGYAAGRLEFMMTMHAAIGFCTEAVHIYEAGCLTAGETDPDDEEFIETAKFSVAEAIEMIRGGEITDGKTIAALLMHAHENKILID